MYKLRGGSRGGGGGPGDEMGEYWRRKGCAGTEGILGVSGIMEEWILEERGTGGEKLEKSGVTGGEGRY